MKHVISFVCAAMVMSGCQKEQIDSLPAGYTAHNVLKDCNCGNYRVFYDTPNNPHCADSGGNCLPDFILDSAHFSVVSSVGDSLFTKSPSAIKNAFSYNRSTLLLYMPVTQVDGVIAGTYSASARNNASSHCLYILIGPDNSPINVYPMK